MPQDAYPDEPDSVVEGARSDSGRITDLPPKPRISAAVAAEVAEAKEGSADEASVSEEESDHVSAPDGPPPPAKKAATSTPPRKRAPRPPRPTTANSAKAPAKPRRPRATTPKVVDPGPPPPLPADLAAGIVVPPRPPLPESVPPDPVAEAVAASADAPVQESADLDVTMDSDVLEREADAHSPAEPDSAVVEPDPPLVEDAGDAEPDNVAIIEGLVVAAQTADVEPPTESVAETAGAEHPSVGADVAAVDTVPTVDVVTEDVVTEDVVTEDVVTADVVTEDVVTEDVVTEDVAIEDAAIDGVTIEDAPIEDLSPEASAPRAAGEGVAALAMVFDAEHISEPLGEGATPALAVRGVTKFFGETRAVDGIDLTVPAGTFYGLVGPNGAGKTTTLSMIAGLLRPTRGTITVNGIDATDRSGAAKRMMGVLPDRLRTFDRLTGRQLLYYYGVLRGLSPAVVESRTADLARAFDLTDALGRVVSDYSAGMTKKVMLAGAMIHSPRLLVLDEPFEAVDPVSSAIILDILGTYVAHGGTVVLSSHGMDLVERVCSRVAVIVAGQVLAEGTIDEVRGELTLEQRFIELAGGLSDVEGLEWLHTFSD
ncbi:ATP-binding cassette domain-containing protein [Microbacterium rhizomatis]|uniref:ATP-binding cassette domain-containing protein n=2 Tax=Microbacterium rhizomatis TaxID=1631477 RepID=A0A5J5J969_9MICO|nr:ATP-binding cassette domain-containing protein [Microbacterium rhizomatis]